MLTFFRRIRKGLLSESATSKYLLYAVGEILLVMVGILLALQVNNWNEERKKNNLRQSYIKNLIIDLNTDIEHLEWLNTINADSEKAGFYLNDFMENKLIEIDTLRLTKAIVYCAYIPNITIVSSTFNDLINSNNMNLFQEVDLKRTLDDYYVNVKWEDLFNDRILKTAWYDYKDEMTKFHNPLLYRDYYLLDNGTASDLSTDLTKYQVDWGSIRTNAFLQKQVEMILAYRIIIGDKINNNMSKAKTILNHLKSIE